MNAVLGTGLGIISSAIGAGLAWATVWAVDNAGFLWAVFTS